MRIKSFFFVSLCSAVMLAAALPAQAETLQGLQRGALSNRQLVERYRANLEKQEKNVGVARSHFLPRLDGSYTVNQLDEPSLFEAEENSVALAAVSWNLFAGFQDYYGLKSAKHLRGAESYRLHGIEQDIQLNVALRYLTIYDRQASLRVATDFHNTLLKVYTDAEHRFQVGLINKNELLKIKVDLDNAEIAAKKAAAELDKSVELLNREAASMVGLAELEFSEFDQLPELAGEAEYEQKLFNQRSEIRALEELETAAGLNVKGARSHLLPRLDLTSSYRKYESDYWPGDGLDRDEEVRHQLTLSINLFEGFAGSSRVSAAKAEERGVRADLAELKAEMATGLRNLFLDYEVSRGTVTVAETSISQAEENLRITRLSYKEGLATTSDLLDAIANLSRAQYNYVAAKSQLFGNYFLIVRMVEEF